MTFSHDFSSTDGAMRLTPIFLSGLTFMTISILCLVIGNAQINESSSVPEIELSQWRHRAANPLGEKALAIHPEQWKHGETEHFIYHFVLPYVATPVSVEA